MTVVAIAVNNTTAKKLHNILCYDIRYMVHDDREQQTLPTEKYSTVTPHQDFAVKQEFASRKSK
jgi:hypothetical protein